MIKSSTTFFVLTLYVITDMHPAMKMARRVALHPPDECRPGAGRTAEQEVFLNVLETADLLQLELV